MSGGGELQGRVAVVTGGAGGIGEATARLLASEGASVVIGDVDVAGGERAARVLGPAVAFQRADVAEARDVEDLMAFAVERFGGLDVMFNNAGVPGSFRRLLADDLRDFERVMAVNVLGVMLGTRSAARRMAETGGGSIVNTTSIAGISAGAGFTTYRAAKAAVIHFTRSAALELAEHGIRVNCIAPAHIATAMNAAYDVTRVVRTMQPLQRQGRPEDVAQAVLYLAGERSAQVTGVVLPVDGGTTVGRPTDIADARGAVAGGAAVAGRASGAGSTGAASGARGRGSTRD